MCKIHFRVGYLLAGILSISLFLAACSPATPIPIEETMPPVLAGTNWQLESINDVSPVGEIAPVLFFANELTAVGYTGCNLMNAGYNIVDNQIQLDPFQSSYRVCDDELKAQEEAIIVTLDSASNYQLEGDILILTNPDDSRRATYTQLPPFPLEGTSWVLNSYNDGQGALVTVLEGTEISVDFSEGGQLSGYAGCNNYNASYETEGINLTIGPVVTTRMACDQPEGVMEQESNYLLSFENADLFYNVGVGLLLETENRTPIALYFVK